MTDSYTAIIVVTFLGFMALAALLLIPVYRFLNREERISHSWTEEALAEEARRRDAEGLHGDDGQAPSSADSPETPAPHSPRGHS